MIRTVECQEENCHSSNVKKPSVCRTAVEMWEDSEGLLNEGTLGENVEAKHSPHLDLNGCRVEERIETSRGIDLLEKDKFGAYNLRAGSSWWYI